jgi:hypothetical protein
MTKLTDPALNGHPLTYGSEKLQNGCSDSRTKTETPQATDITRWRLLDECGRQTWHYLTTDEAVQAWPQTIADKHFLGLPLVSIASALFLPLPPSAMVWRQAGDQTYRKTEIGKVGSSRPYSRSDSPGCREQCAGFLFEAPAPAG